MRRNRLLKVRKGKEKGWSGERGDLLSMVGRRANRNKKRRRPVNTVYTHKNGCNKIANPAINTSDTVSLRGCIGRFLRRPLPHSDSRSYYSVENMRPSAGMGRSCTQIAGNTYKRIGWKFMGNP